jgi:hypothetical protein
VRIGKTVLGLRGENGGAIAGLSPLEIVGIEDDEDIASKPSEARGHDLAVKCDLAEGKKLRAISTTDSATRIQFIFKSGLGGKSHGAADNSHEAQRKGTSDAR